MLGGRLVRLIETHSDQLTRAVVLKLRTSQRSGDYNRIPESELHDGVLNIYRHLSDWLLTKTESDIELRFTQTGAKRAAQGISISAFVWGMMVIKEQLWAFLQREARADKPVELYSEVELLYLLEQFFDRAMYYATVGFEHHHAQHRKAA